MPSPFSPDIAIIGAGPCGLMAAEVLARAGFAVSIYDRMASPARKFLIAGRGGLNLTHSEPLERFLSRYGAAQEWLAPSIRAFTPDDLRAWCEGLGEPTFIGSSGRVFPTSMKAVQLLRAWLQRLENLGVQYLPRHTWLGWEGDNLRFEDAEKSPLLVKPKATLLALGGASWPRLGSDGSWVKYLPAQDVVPLQPANCGFLTEWSATFAERFAGQPLKPVAVSHGGQTRQGEAMLTARGVEGGVFYALSASIREALLEQGKTQVHIDTRPQMELAALTQKLEAVRGNKSFSRYMQGLGFSPLIINLLYETQTQDALKQASAEQLAGWLKALPLTLTGMAGMERAISSAGGIKREAVTDDFMLRSLPGVFAAGEMLDWDAPTGGYLLQGCYSTAVSAAQGIMRYLKP